MATLYKRLVEFFTPTSALSDSDLGKIVSVGHCAEVRTAGSSDKVAKCIKIGLLHDNLSSTRKDIRTWQKLRHPNLVKCLGTSECPDYLYILLENCQGGSLRKFLNGRTCSVSRIKSIAADILAGLNWLHSHKIVYGVLKPSHILFKGPSALLADFASARSEYTLENYVYYAAPETIEGSPSQAGDLWALGVTLFLASTGKLPFNGIDTEEVIQSIQQNEPNWSLLPEELSPLIQGLLKKDPSRRSTALEALEFLYSK